MSDVRGSVLDYDGPLNHWDFCARIRVVANQASPVEEDAVWVLWPPASLAGGHDE